MHPDRVSSARLADPLREDAEGISAAGMGSMALGTWSAKKVGLHRIARLIPAGLAFAALLSPAQQRPGPALAETRTEAAVAPSPAAEDARGAALGTVIGTVKDTNGNTLEGATVTLTSAAGSEETRTATADANGFFLLSVEPGQYVAIVSSPGLASWTSGDVAVTAGKFREIANIVLKVNPAISIVRVTPSQQEIAEQQIRLQEHQRIGGMFPNFFVSYVPDAAPLTTRQKFELAWKSSIDPGTFISDAITGAVEQAQNQYPAYRQGLRGYAKRFGAEYANDAGSNFIGGAILPTLFHQDPRYFWRGTGSYFSRAAYAVSTIAIAKGDNGKWQPNYSFVLGNLASGALSNLYYPAGNRGWGTTLKNGTVTTLMGTTGALLQEFVFPHFSRGVPK
ncbi:MAG: carboxypeptidase regulatory-like domain-containing protein [Acidobacteriaceae bacterium]